MAVNQIQPLITNTFVILRINFSTTSLWNNKWRLKQGLEPNPNRYGPIKMLPDYSFVDGRIVPLSFKKIKQMEYQQKLCQRIVELNQELQVGLQQYYEQQEQQKKAKEFIIQHKLKPKGSALVKKKSEQSYNKTKESKETGNSL